VIFVHAFGTLFPKAMKLMQRDYNALGAFWVRLGWSNILLLSNVLDIAP
jgi:hypothetical protein